MILTLDLDINNYKVQTFLDFIKTLDFIKIKEDEKFEDFILKDGHIKILDERKHNYVTEKSKTYSWTEVKDEIRNLKV